MPATIMRDIMLAPRPPPLILIVALPHLDRRGTLAGGTSLLLYPVREHYLVYEPLAPGVIAIVAVIRQGRDIPAILQKWAAPIRRELPEIRGKIERREVSLSSGRRVPKPRHRKK